MKTISKLLELVKEHYLKFVELDKHRSLCGIVGYLHTLEIITLDELEVLKKYIKNNRPEDSGERAYWYNFNNDWDIALSSPEFVEKRTKWLEEQINLLN